MDLLKLGLRTLIGIALPGAILATVVLGELCAVLWLQEVGPPIDPSWVRALIVPFLVVLFPISYLVGSLSRMGDVDHVDKIASKRLRQRYSHIEGFEEPPKEFETWRQQLLDEGTLPPELNDPFPAFEEWLQYTESFPYPASTIRRVSLCSPPDMAACLTRLRSHLRQKQFFIFCQMTVRCLRSTVGDALRDEMDYHEALVRFYAGTYFALGYSLFTLPLFVLATAGAGSLLGKGSSLSSTRELIAIFVSAAIGAIFLIWREAILQRFRLLRLKEVAIVFDAFYLALASAEHALRDRLFGGDPPGSARPPVAQQRSQDPAIADHGGLHSSA